MQSVDSFIHSFILSFPRHQQEGQSGKDGFKPIPARSDDISIGERLDESRQRRRSLQEHSGKSQTIGAASPRRQKRRQKRRQREEEKLQLVKQTRLCREIGDAFAGGVTL